MSVQVPARQILLIAAHGSSTDERARAQVLRQADRVATLVPHDVTVTGFARGEPSIDAAIARCLAAANGAPAVITVVPFMTSAGHYATQVLPHRLQDAMDRRGAVHVSIVTTRPVGASRRIASILQRRALRIAAQQRWLPRDVAVVVVGHGTRRQGTSRDTALAHVRALSARGWGEVRAAFIDDDPAIPQVVAGLTSQHVIVLPFLIGGGAHHLVDIPMALGFDAIGGDADAPAAPMRDASGRTFALDAALGSDDALADIAASLAARAWQRNAGGVSTSRRKRRGSVHLVGAGPGAPDLITVRGQRALARADVVLHDRLVSPAILAMAAAHARLIDVGKESFTPQGSQQSINERLISEARRGNRVVRLKGGDPFVFGRGSEEWEACLAAGIPVRVTPGLTSALVAPAMAGVPVTARQISRVFAVVTASTDEDDEVAFERLRRLVHVDTLVILMGRARLRVICADQIAAGRAPDTPVTCIERATMPGERIVRGTLRTIADKAEAQALGAPMVTVIGETARGVPLHAGTATRTRTNDVQIERLATPAM